MFLSLQVRDYTPTAMLGALVGGGFGVRSESALCRCLLLLVAVAAAVEAAGGSS